MLFSGITPSALSSVPLLQLPVPQLSRPSSRDTSSRKHVEKSLPQPSWVGVSTPPVCMLPNHHYGTSAMSSLSCPSQVLDCLKQEPHHLSLSLASSPEPGTRNSRARWLPLHHMGKERSRKEGCSSAHLSFPLSLKVELSPGLMDQRGNIVILKFLDLADPRGMAHGQLSVLERVAGTFKPQHQRRPEISRAHISRLLLGREGRRPTSDLKHPSAAGTIMPSTPRSCHHPPPPSTSYTV